MKRRTFLSAVAGLSAMSAVSARSAVAWPAVDVFKSPTCGCCGAWVDHLKAAGFDVRVNEVDDTTAVRKRLGMPDAFGACHTARVGGYVLEGHVPAAEVKRLLGAKPKAIGLAVPGMPVGSPGMEVGSRHDPFDVLLVERNGRSTVYAHYPQ